MAVVGQFTNILGIVNGFSNGGISSGIVKYVSEYRNDEKLRQEFLISSILLSFSSALIVGILFFILKEIIAEHILHEKKFSIFIVFLIPTAFLVSFYNSLMSLLNGLQKIHIFTSLNALSGILLIIFSFILIPPFKINGVMSVLILSQAIISIFSLWVCRPFWIPDRNNIKCLIYFDKLKLLLKFSGMAITTVVTVNISQLLIRNYIIQNLSMGHAGIWQGMVKISDAYLGFITSTLAVYYLPKLSALRRNDEIKLEIISLFRVILPSLLLITIAIYSFRHFVIRCLFTESFMVMADLFAFYLIGDILKISSWLISFIMVAKAMSTTFIITELFFSLTYVILSILFMKFYGFAGVSYSWAANYFLYLLCMLFILRAFFRRNNSAC